MTILRLSENIREDILNRDWDIRFLELALQIASWSKDPSTKVGCVITTPDKRIVSTGYNGLPRGCDDNVKAFPERHNRELQKYDWYEHAERNAIYNAANLGNSLNGCIAFVTVMHPCTDCTRALIQSGIKRVVWQEPNDPDVAKRWEFQIKLSMLMFAEAGVVTTSHQICPESPQKDS